VARHAAIGGMRQVHIHPVPLDQLAELLEPERAEALASYAEQSAERSQEDDRRGRRLIPCR
jgi:hypothetical protein